MTGVYDRVLARLDSLAMSESDLARAVGEFPQTLHNWKRRGSVPAGKLLSVANVLGVSTDWLLGAEDKTPQREDVSGLKSALTVCEARAAHAITPPGYVRVELLDVRAGAGSGCQNSDHPEVVRYLDILESHLRHVLRVDPAQLRLATAWGDSMAGTILHNDLMAIDISQQAFRGPAIYLFEWEGLLMVKRLSVLMDGRLEVRSDNPAYAPEYLRGEDADRLRIVGRLAGVLSLRAL